MTLRSSTTCSTPLSGTPRLRRTARAIVTRSVSRARRRTVATRTLLAALAITAVLAPVSAGAEPVPGSRCRVFPASNIWNTRIDALPVHEMSETWLRSADAGSTDLHPDFGPPAYGLPFDVV